MGGTPPPATGLFLGAAAVFALGETLMTPSLPAIVNDLAPEALRGRYNGGLTLAYTTGFIAGPLLSSLALDRGLAPLLFVALIAGRAVVARLALRLERHLPTLANLSPPPDAKPPPSPGGHPATPPMGVGVTP